MYRLRGCNSRLCRLIASNSGDVQKISVIETFQNEFLRSVITGLWNIEHSQRSDLKVRLVGDEIKRFAVKY